MNIKGKNKMIRLLIADDQRLFADMLKTILQAQEEFDVVAYAGSGQEAVEQYKAHIPDICLLDIQMPESNGLFALEKIKEINPDAGVIMLTTFSDDDNIIAACLGGADGYLLKDILPEVLTDAIKCVHSGLVVMSKEVRGLLAEKLRYQSQTAGLKPQNEFKDKGFDERDIQIICLIAKGMSNKAIAEQMNYSEGTVRNRVSNILAVTGLNDRTQIALFAIKNRLV